MHAAPGWLLMTHCRGLSGRSHTMLSLHLTIQPCLPRRKRPCIALPGMHPVKHSMSWQLLTGVGQALRGWYVAPVWKQYRFPFMVDSTRSMRPSLSKSSASTEAYAVSPISTVSAHPAQACTSYVVLLEAHCIPSMTCCSAAALPSTLEAIVSVGN